MVRKKGLQKQQQPLSPANYIRLKGRSLPIVNCYINEEWQKDGLAFIIVARQHQSGSYTMGKYLVDTFCLGVKDTDYEFNIDSDEYEDILEQLPGKTEITYNEAHNIIYGAIAFAEEEANILPHPDFALTQLLLEEDTGRIPLIEYEFGKDNKPFLAVNTKLEASKYLPILREKLGDDVLFLIREDEPDEYDEYENWEEEDDELFNPLITDELLEEFEENLIHRATLPQTQYTYIHPQYPLTLELTHQELMVVYSEDFFHELPPKELRQILDLPRVTLIEDLNRIILYELGQYNNDLFDQTNDENNALTHVLLLLSELKASESLQTVLKLLRQDNECLDYYFIDTTEELMRLTLYDIARNQTDALLMFLKEPGLECFPRSCIFSVMGTIATNEPERWDEVINWFRELLTFMTENTSDTSTYDAVLAGLLTSELLDMNARELLPEIKDLYDTGLVDLTCCGDYSEIKKKMENPQESLSDYSLMDISRKYKSLAEKWY